MTNREYTEAELREGFYLIPSHMHEGVLHYVLDGIPGDSFLQAVFGNAPLKECVIRADDLNQRAIANWVKFIYNHVPVRAQGSAEAVKDWKGVSDE
jgi:hypothetical protein